MKQSTLPREVIDHLLAANDELVDIVANNVLKRIPKRQSAAVVKRASLARNALLHALRKEDQ